MFYVTKNQKLVITISLITIFRISSTLAQESLSDNSDESLMNDFHAKNKGAYRNPTGTFNANIQYANRYPHTISSLPLKTKLENLQYGNVNLQVVNDELINKKSSRRFALPKTSNERTQNVRLVSRRTNNNPENQATPTDSMISESQVSSKVYTYPKHLQTKKPVSEQDISFRRDSSPAYFQNNPINIPSQDEGEEESVEIPQIQDENSQGFIPPYPNQLPYQNALGRIQNFPFVGCRMKQQVISMQIQMVPSCHHFIGFSTPSNNYDVLQDMKSLEWQLRHSPIMNVLFSPATVPLNTPMMAWPSKLKTRKYLPPYIQSPNRVVAVANNLNLPGVNFRQSMENENSSEGVISRQLQVPQTLINNPINGILPNVNLQPNQQKKVYVSPSLTNVNLQQRPNQQKKVYISPSLRVNKTSTENADGIDVRMDKSSDEEPINHVTEMPIDEGELGSKQVSDETDEKEVQSKEEVKSEPKLKEEKTSSENQAMKALRRQFLVNVFNLKAKNEEKLQSKEEEKPQLNLEDENSENSKENLHEEPKIMNQVKEDSNKNGSRESGEYV